MTYDDIIILDKNITEEVKVAMGDKFPKIINFFLEDTIMYANQIKNGIANNDIEEIIKGSHTIKSSSQQIGALKLSAIAKDIEIKGRELIEKDQGSLEEIKELIPLFNKTTEETITLINKYHEK